MSALVSIVLSVAMGLSVERALLPSVLAQNCTEIKADGNPNWKAYVLLGDTSLPVFGVGWWGRNFGLRIANRAISQFRAANYTVEQNTNGATIGDLTIAVNDPCTRALWVIAHGKGIPAALKGVNIPIKIGQYIEGIDMTDGQVRGFDQGNGAPNCIPVNTQGGVVCENVAHDDVAPLPQNPHLNVVTINACGQEKTWPSGFESWRGSFPNARIESWPGAAFLPEIFDWQKTHTYPAIDPVTGNERAAGPIETNTLAANQLVVDPRLDPVGTDADFPKLGLRFPLCYADNRPANDCLLQGTLIGEQFGNQTFNFFGVNDTNPSQANLLLAASVQNGCVSPISVDPVASSFNVSMTDNALFSTLQNTDTFQSLVAAGQVSIVRSVTSPPPEVLLEGFHQVLFGVPMFTGFNATATFLGESTVFTAGIYGGYAPYQYNWNFGDGTTGSGGPQVGHTYTTNGLFTATVTVQDSKGTTKSFSDIAVVNRGGGGGCYGNRLTGIGCPY